MLQARCAALSFTMTPDDIMPGRKVDEPRRVYLFLAAHVARKFGSCLSTIRCKNDDFGHRFQVHLFKGRAMILEHGEFIAGAHQNEWWSRRIGAIEDG